MSESSAGRASWTTLTRPYSEHDLSSCLAKGQLTVGDSRLATNRVQLVFLQLVEWAIAKRRSVILRPPHAYSFLAGLTAATAHVASMARYHERTGQAKGSDMRIAVVTPNLRIRGLYRRLGIDFNRLTEVIPPATLTRDGEISILGRDRGRGWSTLFVSTPAELRGIDGLSLAVVELPLRGGADLESLDVPLIVIAHDPSEKLLIRLVDRLPVFALDADDLRELQEIGLKQGAILGEETLRLEQIASGTTSKVLRVPAPRVSANAALFWQDIGPLMRAGQSSLFGRELVAAAFVLFYDLLHLAIPADLYEAATVPIRSRIREIQQAQRLTQGDLRDLYVPMVTTELTDLAAAIGPDPPKASALLALLRERTAIGANVLLVARTAELARIYQSYLQRHSALESRVTVSNLWGVAEQAPADVAVFVGLLPSTARYLYNAGLAGETLVLAYDFDDETREFSEASQVRSILEYQEGLATWLARDAAKIDCWNRLSDDTVECSDPDPHPPAAPNVSIAVADAPRPPERDVENLVGAPLGTLDLLERRLTVDESPVLSALEAGGDQSLTASALHIEFTDGRWMLIASEALVTRYRSRTGTPDQGLPADDLAPGDQVLFLDGQARKDLLAKVLEVAAELPDLAVPAAWIDYWRKALRRAYRAFRTYSALQDQLAKAGCSRQAQTIRLWVVGATIGPDDPEDIRRVGEVISDQVLIDSYGQINRAIEALRSAHVKLGRRVAVMARLVGSATEAGRISGDEVIDEQTGLTAADFHDSIDILTIDSIAQAGEVPLAVTGRLFQRDTREISIV